MVSSRFFFLKETYMKISTSVEEQIEKLRSRGMKFQDESYAKEILLDIGYYRLGFYWFPFEKSYPQKENRTHILKEESLFETCVELYNFDKGLRNILAGFLYDIEVNIRTKVIYYLSNRYKENPMWFADSKIMMSKFVTEFEKKFYSEIRNNDVISRHLTNHQNDRYAPAWKTLEYVSFGDLIRIINNLRSSEARLEIFNCYGLNDDKTFPNYIDAIKQLRNHCAHAHPLYDYTMHKSLRAGKFKRVLKGVGDDIYHNLIGNLLVMQYFLFYLPDDKGNEFRAVVKAYINSNCTEAIKPMIGYLSEIPWLENKI